MFNDKKGLTWQQIAIAVIVLIVVVVVVTMFTRGGSKAFGGISDKISGTGDCDKDGTANMFDKCPCDASITDEFPEETKECSKKCTGDEKVDCLK